MALPRTAVAAAAILLAGLLVASAAAAGLPRFYSAKPHVALTTFEQAIDRTGPFTDADCWVYSGNRQAGWRHIGCVGNYNYAGSVYRFKLVTTPKSCSRIGEVITVSGGGTKRQTVGWHHKTFTCKR